MRKVQKGNKGKVNTAILRGFVSFNEEILLKLARIFYFFIFSRTSTSKTS